MAKYDKESVFRVLPGFWGKLIELMCIAFSLFHLYTAAFGQLPPQLQRSIHLGFALSLIFLLYPARASSDRSRMHWPDILLAALSVWCCSYIITNYEAIVLQTELPSTVDIIHGGITILLVLEAARRIVGLPIILVAVAFLCYAKFGNYIPGMLGHRGFSLNRIISHMYLTTEGIFGMPLGVSASFVFLFILFGAFLHRTGLGKFFIDLALSVTGHKAGGPAKVAVFSSCLFGTISGSSVANTVSTGTFTIPLMKSVGYRGAFAGAVESASSTGGQIMPPIMGAAAFIMSQFLGISYIEIAKSAILPALLYYLAVGMMVHMEALRLGLKGIPKEHLPNLKTVLTKGGYLLIPIVIMIYLLVSGYTPFKAAFYCIVTTAIIAVLSNVVKEMILAGRGEESQSQAAAKSAMATGIDMVAALENGARSALSVAAACASTGLVIGVVTLTGVGLKLANAVVSLSGGNFFLTLLFTMFASIILGMGLPTTAKYIVLATIAAPAIQNYGVPPLAAHLFIMYFGILADLTPPVALVAYAAAGIAKASPNQTGFMAVKLASAGFLIPYIFCYNPGLLLINTTPAQTVFFAITAVTGIFALSFACVGYWRGNLVWWQRIALIVSSVLLMSPDGFTDVAGFLLMAFALGMQKMSGRYRPRRSSPDAEIAGEAAVGKS
ncbi:MAG: TRAP transporter permease [Planctomycetes bacterium]|nr:TRAP transporter permease [Planctomycetota bacterium]